MRKLNQELNNLTTNNGSMRKKWDSRRGQEFRAKKINLFIYSRRSITMNKSSIYRATKLNSKELLIY